MTIVSLLLVWTGLNNAMMPGVRLRHWFRVMGKSLETQSGQGLRGIAFKSPESLTHQLFQRSHPMLRNQCHKLHEATL
jgi:hypothetical protein